MLGVPYNGPEQKVVQAQLARLPRIECKAFDRLVERTWGAPSAASQAAESDAWC